MVTRTPEQIWASILRLLNDGDEEEDADQMVEDAHDLILLLEGTSPMPDNCRIKGLSRQGFINMLYLIKYGLG